MNESSTGAGIVWPLTPTAAAALTVADIQAMTVTQAATLTASTLDALSASAFSAMSYVQAQALAPSALAGLTTTQAMNLTRAEVAALTIDQTAALTTQDISEFVRPQLVTLNTAGLSAAQIEALARSQTRVFNTAQLNALSADALSALIPNITAAQVGELSTTAVASLSKSALASLHVVRANLLSAADLNVLTAGQLQALPLSELSADVASRLSARVIGIMSASEFAAALGDDVASLTTTALKGVTVAEIDALSSTQLAAFSTAQAAALSPAAAAALVYARDANDPVLSDFVSKVSDGAISYSGLLQVLQDTASGGMTASKLAALDEIAAQLASGVVATSAYAAQIFDDVVTGNSANATWTGGAANSVALGSLSATTDQAQFDELIGKWFLGTDLPSYQQEAGASASGYRAYNLPLFSSGGPQYTDVNQGGDGDCFFMAALATEAQQNPLWIENMIQSMGDDVYAVKFEVNGRADYVTVNNQLVALAANESYPSGGTQAFANSASNLWAPLLEKAYAELMAQAGVVTYAGVGNIDSYSAIDGGDSNGLQAITGQNVVEDAIGAWTSTSTVQNDLSAAQSAFDAHEGVMLGTSNNSQLPNSNWVADHMFTVTGVNAAAGTVELFNPWGTAAASPGFATQFTATLADLQKMGVTLEYAVGSPATA
jgi:hypothetical protein